MIIASDGLDVGDPETLRETMRILHRRAASVVWLNPLLETPGYEPTASGMRAAQPFVSTFAQRRRLRQTSRGWRGSCACGGMNRCDRCDRCVECDRCGTASRGSLQFGNRTDHGICCSAGH